MGEFARRRIGRTGVEVSVLGLGCATLGGRRVDVSRRTAEAIVRAAWNAGVRYVDAAPYYGFGQAERCVGDALRDKPRDAWVLSSKVGRLLQPRPGTSTPADRPHMMPFDPVYDYSHDGIMRSVEDSLQRLGLARIDILYVHDIGAMQHGADAHPELMRILRNSGYRALETLRKNGVVGAIGIGVNEREVLLEQAPLDDLLPRCEKAGTSIVVGGPLNSGILAGRDTWNYALAPSAVTARVKKLRAVCDRHNVPLAAAALQFPLAHKAVAAIIPGPRDAAEFRANVALFNHPIPPDLWAELRHTGLLHPEAPTPG